jgi:ABC-type branched-subunit amino acid transport system ATPase component
VSTSEALAAAAVAGPVGAPLLALERVGVDFGGVTALSEVTLSFEGGDLCGLIGPNGAGKTTLFDVISGVRVPDRGRVLLDGQDATRWPATKRARWRMRRTFQRVQTFGWLSVEDNLLVALEWPGGGGGMLADLAALPSRRHHERARRQRVEEVLELTGLVSVRRATPSSLPVGLARMVELGRCLVERPRVLLLDEPTSGLDDHEIERLGDRIRAVRTEEQCAVLVVEHNMGFVMEHCDRVVALEMGRVIATGTPLDIQANEAVRAAYLGRS